MTIQNVADRQRVRNADSGWGQIGSGRDADQPWWTTSATPPVAHVIRRVSRQRILCDHRAKRIAGRMRNRGKTPGSSAQAVCPRRRTMSGK
jgi:hypothetical protein